MRRQINRKKYGFTLAEILIAIAILVVLIGVSVPAIAKTYQDMEITKLDAQARIIYAAAQNRFTAFQSAGTISEVVPDGAYDYAAGLITDAGKSRLAKSPDNNNQIIYIKSKADGYGRSIINKLFPTGVMDANIMDTVMNLHGEMIIEYDPSSGSVYGVFYSESPITYNDEFKQIGNRSHDSRKAMAFGGTGERAGEKVGFYGGDAIHVDAPPVLPGLKASTEELPNEYGHPAGLYFKVDVSTAYTGNHRGETVDISKWTYNVKMTELDDYGNPVKLGAEEDAPEKYIEDTFATDNSGTPRTTDNGKFKLYKGSKDGEYYLLIDSLEQGNHFYEGFGPGSTLEAENIFTVGANVKMELSIEQNVDEGGTAINENTFIGVNSGKSIVFNPIYGTYSRTLKDDTNTGEKVVESINARIANARQLQNLNTEISGVTLEYAPTHVTQTADIDLKSGLDKVSVYNVTTTQDYGTGIFVPIFDENLVSYNGQNRKIMNMDATTLYNPRMGELIFDYFKDENSSTDENTKQNIINGHANKGGLFALVFNGHNYTSVLKDIVIVNPKVTIPVDIKKIVEVGTVAGAIYDANIYNCKVYCDKEASAGFDYNNYGIFDSGLRDDGEQSNIGGFASEIYDSNISDCYVSIPRIKATPQPASIASGGGTLVSLETKRAGGFAFALSSVTSCTVEKCYANIGEVEGFGLSAGFVVNSDGNRSGGESIDADTAMVISDCYAAGEHLSTNVGGFFGFNDRTAVRNCYTVCTYGEDFDTKEGWISGFSYRSFFANMGFEDNAQYENCYYLLDGEKTPTSWRYATINENGDTVIQGGLCTMYSKGVVTYAPVAGIEGVFYEAFNTNVASSLGDSFTLGNNASTVAYNRPETIYPFPILVGQIHYGDWPLINPASDGKPIIKDKDSPSQDEGNNIKASNLLKQKREIELRKKEEKKQEEEQQRKEEEQKKKEEAIRQEEETKPKEPEVPVTPEVTDVIEPSATESPSEEPSSKPSGEPSPEPSEEPNGPEETP